MALEKYSRWESLNVAQLSEVSWEAGIVERRNCFFYSVDLRTQIFKMFPLRKFNEPFFQADDTMKLQIKESDKKVEAWILPTRSQSTTFYLINVLWKSFVICSINHFYTFDGKNCSAAAPLKHFTSEYVKKNFKNFSVF